LSSPNIEGSASSRILERQQLQEKVETLQEELKTTKKVLQFLKEDNERLITENEKNKDINNLKNELATLQSNEKALIQKLNKSQETCDNLVAQNRVLQEEKHELIKSLSELATLPELKKELEKARKRFEVAQKQNRTLTDDLETMQKQLSITDKVMKDQVESLSKDLAIATKSESNLRKSLDEAQKAGEDLLKRCQELQEENNQSKDISQKETRQMKTLLGEKDRQLSHLKDEVEQLNEDIQSKDDASAILKNRLEDVDKTNQNLESILRDKTLVISKLDQVKDEIEQENSDLKMKLDEIKSAKQMSEIERSQELVDLKDQLIHSEEKIKVQTEIMAEKSRLLLQLVYHHRTVFETKYITLLFLILIYLYDMSTNGIE